MDMHWLAGEAKRIHETFAALFYSLVALLLVSGVLLSYFRMPMGQVPDFLKLVGRAVAASLILAAFPEIMNALAGLTDDLARELGKLDNFKLVVGRLGQKIGTLTWSWVSVKDSVLLVVSYFSFFVLYVTVYLADALFVFTWMLLYVFSPLLIAAFVLPSTAQATKGLFQSLVEVCMWKVSWSVLAALLWSYALSEVNQPQYGVDFLSAIILNLLLAFSLLATPFVVRALFKGGAHAVSVSMGGAILGAAALTPTGISAKIAGSVARPVRLARARLERKRTEGAGQTRLSGPKSRADQTKEL